MIQILAFIEDLEDHIEMKNLKIHNKEKEQWNEQKQMIGKKMA